MSLTKPDLSNPKDFFLAKDALYNISYDACFSIFKKYKCQAGCKICYIQNDWISDERFEQYVPNTYNDPEYVKKVIEFASYFEVMSTIDDMRFIKDKHPDIFNFYKENAGYFYLSSLSDNAILRQATIIAEDIDFKGIREISISTTFLNDVNIKKLLNGLTTINNKSKILQIKLIVMNASFNEDKINDLIDWTRFNQVDISKQLEFDQMSYNLESLLPKKLADLKDAVSYESTAYSEEFGEIYPIQSEIVFLMFDDFYTELKSATLEDRSPPFSTIRNFEPTNFLTDVLKGKLEIYQRYTNQIKQTNNPYYEYFKYISTHLRVNDNYNFIPNILIKPYTQYYKQLVKSGKMIETKYGLLKPGADTVVPIIKFSETPIVQQKVFFLQQT